MAILKNVILVAYLGLIAAPLKASQPPPPTGGNRDSDQDHTMPRQEESRSYPQPLGTSDNPVFVQNKPTAEERRRAEKEEQDRLDGALNNWWMSMSLLCVSVTTGIVVGWQAWEARKAAEASLRSVEQADRHFALTNAQWLDMGLVCVQALPAEMDGGPGRLWQVKFRIQNRTSYPVRVKTIEVYIEGDYTVLHTARTVLPGRDFRPIIHATRVADVTLQAVSMNQPVIVGVFACVTFTNAFEQDISQSFGRRGQVASTEPTRLKKVIPGGEDVQRFVSLRRQHGWPFGDQPPADNG